MSKRQRKLKNYLLNPREQTAFAIRAIGVPMLLVFFVIAAAQLPLMAYARMGADDPKIHELVSNVVRYELVWFTAAVATMFAYAVVVSHRVFGPVKGLELHLRKLIAGERGVRRLSFRDGDHFHEIADLVNELGERLGAYDEPNEPEDATAASAES